jgi:hypothetical protein
MKQKHIIKKCKHHGNSEYILEGRNYYRCKKCRSQHVSNRRKNIKLQLVEYFGGQCKICGYKKCIGALEFHHKNPKEKKFHLGCRGLTRSFEKTLEEAKKCILVCANCHREIEYNKSVPK